MKLQECKTHSSQKKMMYRRDKPIANGYWNKRGAQMEKKKSYKIWDAEQGLERKIYKKVTFITIFIIQGPIQL